MTANLGGKDYITPLMSQLSAFMAKLASILNPVVFAVSHPKFRLALGEKVPCLGIHEKQINDNNDTALETMQSGSD